MRFVATNTQILSGSRHDSAIRISNNKVGLRWSESKQHIRNFRRESRKLMSQNQPEIQYAAFLAIDWADQKHVWSLQDANSSTCERGEVDHMPEAVEAWVAQMSQRFAGRPIAVAVEQSRGALVFLLSKYEQLHIFPVPPAMTANLRKAFYSSGAKSDPTDADLLLDLVQRHREKLRRLSPDTEATRLIQNLVEERRNLVDEKTAQSNRLEAHLKIYFPQIPRWFGDVDSPLVCALLERWPHAGSAANGATGHLAEFFSQASQSQGGADREPDQSHRGGHARAEGSRRGGGQGGGGQGVGAIDSGSPGGYRRLKSADSGGGRSASRFFHL